VDQASEPLHSRGEENNFGRKESDYKRVAQAKSFVPGLLRKLGKKQEEGKTRNCSVESQKTEKEGKLASRIGTTLTKKSWLATEFRGP